MALPSLLCPLTSIPLHSLPCFLPTNRMPPTNWRLLFQRKLCLLLAPNLPSTCTCGKPLDPYGDHLFTCRRNSKTTLSNKICNTFHTILHTLGLLADFCRNRTDVQCEPTTILSHHPIKRPADISFPPCPLHLPPPLTSQPATLPSIAITVPPVPPSASSLLSQQLPSPLLAAHEGSTRRKFIGRTSHVDAALLITDLNANHITLLPFTVDHLGGLGYFTHAFLFVGAHAPPAPPSQTSLVASQSLSPLPGFLFFPTSSTCPSRPLPLCILPVAITNPQYPPFRFFYFQYFPVPLGPSNSFLEYFPCPHRPSIYRPPLRPPPPAPTFSSSLFQLTPP